jgi:hypothetical protein
MRSRGRVLAGVGVLVVAATMLAAPAPTAAATAEPCWRTILDDWSDGTIERRYAPRCYEAALRNLPTDVRTYTSAEDDIKRALLEAVRTTSFTSVATNGSRALQSRQSGAATSAGTAASTAGATSPPLRLLVGAAFAALLLAAGGIGKLWTRRVR